MKLEQSGLDEISANVSVTAEGRTIVIRGEVTRIAVNDGVYLVTAGRTDASAASRPGR